MADKNNPLNNNKYTDIIDKPSTLYITSKTVQFGREVYQFSNITGFGVSEVKTGNIMPFSWLLSLFILGLLIANFPGINWIGIIMVVLSIVGIISNISQPKKHGLGLFLNSGKEKIFVTTDFKGLKSVVATLYEYMDTEKEMGTYVVNVVEGSVTGNFVGGNATKNNMNFQ